MPGGTGARAEIEVPAQQFRKVSKEIMRDMAGNKLFKDRHPQRVEYEITGRERDLYDAGHRLRRQGSSARSAASSPRPRPASR